MPESGPYGSVRGAAGNSRPYRECRPNATVRHTPGPVSESLHRSRLVSAAEYRIDGHRVTCQTMAYQD
jgi:hypothetical protein